MKIELELPQSIENRFLFVRYANKCIQIYRYVTVLASSDTDLVVNSITIENCVWQIRQQMFLIYWLKWV